MIAEPWLAVPVLGLSIAVVLLARQRFGQPSTLPLADAPLLRGPARRLRLFRVGLILAVAMCLAIGMAVADGRQDQSSNLLISRSDTEVVLDFSASVSDLVYSEIAATLREIVDEASDSQRIGLVLFSDVAHEALPPGTRAEELRPFIRFFLPLQGSSTPRPPIYRPAGPGAPPETRYPLSPWFRTFSGGTRISAGLAAARAALRRDGIVDGDVLLISDLATTEGDLQRLKEELSAYARSGIRLRIVALPPATEVDAEFYERVLHDSTSVLPSSSLVGSRGRQERDAVFPAVLAALVGLVGLALALYELWARPLAWPRTEGKRAV